MLMFFESDFFHPVHETNKEKSTPAIKTNIVSKSC